MAWTQMEAYYQHTLSGLTATSAVTGYPAANLIDGLEGTLWKATTTADQYITFDAGSGNTYKASYFGVQNHNLFTAGATVVLQWSTDNFSGSINDAFTAFDPTNNKAFVKTFAELDKRYWRIKISSASVAPYMGWARWGQKTVLDYPVGQFDPYDESIVANTNMSDGGYLTGVHVKYTERRFPVTFEWASDALYDIVVAMRDFVGMTSFLVCWEPGEHPTDTWLMRLEDGAIAAPFAGAAEMRNITFRLIGRKE